MQHSLDLHLSSLLPVENDTTARPYCGPTSIAAVTGQPLSIVHEAVRRARHGENWHKEHTTAPAVKSMTMGQVTTALKSFGILGRWVPVHGTPTLAAWLDGRSQTEFRSVAVVRVTGHLVAVAGEMFCDTFTRGQVVHIDEAPRRRKRVTHVFYVTGRVPASPIVPQEAAKPKPKAKATSGYADFAKYARSVGATWKKDRDDGELAIFLPDGRTLYCTHTWPAADWLNAEINLERFLSTPEPDEEYFEPSRDGKSWFALYI